MTASIHLESGHLKSDHVRLTQPKSAAQPTDRLPDRPAILAIGGSDSAGMAGIQADLRTIHALGGHALMALTAVTAQHSGAVLGVNPVTDDVLRQQLEAVRPLSPQAIKIGLLVTTEQVRICARFIAGLDGVPVVVDPVFASSSGHLMVEPTVVKAIREELLPLCTLITPNRDEAAQLIDGPLMADPAARARQARQWREALPQPESGSVAALLLKGGHWQDGYSSDYFCDSAHSFWLTSPRSDTRHQRGTGCTLASASATALAMGYSLADAVVIGKMTVNQGLRQGYGVSPEAALQTGAHQTDSWHTSSLQTGALHTGPLQISGFPSDGRDLPWLSAEPFLSATDQGRTEDEGRPDTATPSFPDCGPDPLGLYPVVDRAHWLDTLLPAGVSTIQLRVKDLDGTALREELARGIESARRYGARLFINDYWQLAIELGAYGVHLGQEDLDTADLEAIRAAGLRLGISTHCHYEVARAVRYRPSYLACGPVYPTTSKDMPWRPHGPEGLTYWREVLRDYPLVAIGGINRERFAAISAVGPDGIAMITGLTLAADPVDTAQEFMAIMATHAPDSPRSTPLREALS